MSGLLSSPFQYDSSLMEATVTNVDPIRFVCSVKTFKGQTFDEVSWLLPTGGAGKNGMHVCPNVGDRVVITTSLSYPLIIGSMPQMGVPSSTRVSSTGATVGVDAGAYGSLRAGYSFNPNKPEDFSIGDQVFTGDQGNLFGLLSSGGFVARASHLAQIFLSRFDDLMRLIGRNFQRFSDSCSEASFNVKNRVYNFFGTDNKISRSRPSIYRYTEVTGDITAGEFFKAEPDPQLTAPFKNDETRKRRLILEDGTEVMTEVLKDIGTKVTIVTCPIDKTVQVSDKDTGNLVNRNISSGKTTVEHESAMERTTVTDLKETPSTSVITILPGSIELKHDSTESRIYMDSSQIHMSYGSDSHHVIIDGAGVHMT